MSLPRRLLFVVILMMAAGSVEGGHAPIVRTSLSKSTITVGDTITYRVSVSAGESTLVVPGRPGAALGDFEVLSYEPPPVRAAQGGDHSWAEEFILAAYSPGVHAVPPPAILTVSPQGDTASLAGDTLFVTVESVLSAGDDSLRDIKGPATAPGPSLLRRVLLPAAAALVAAVAVVIVLRRRRRAASLTPAPMRAAAHVEALGRLERLLDLRLLESGRVKEFYTELSEILRAYLDRRFLLPAPELTTRELARRMEYLGLPEAFRREICVVLEESDMVKFAKYRPRVESALNAAKVTRALVRESVVLDEEREAAS